MRTNPAWQADREASHAGRTAGQGIGGGPWATFPDYGKLRRRIAPAGPKHVHALGGAGPHGSRASHQCSACSDGGPCSRCGGNISRNHPAYQALEWGVFGERDSSDPFWRAASVAEAFRSAPSRHADPSWSALSSFLSAISGSLNSVSFPFDSTQAFPLASTTGTGQFITRDPASEGGHAAQVAGGAPECCAELYYPEPDPVPDHEPVIGGHNFFHTFKAYAIYLERKEPEGRVCDCKCCVFRQYLDRKASKAPLGVPQTPETTKSGIDRDEGGVQFGEVMRLRPPGSPPPSPSCRDPNRSGTKSCEDMTGSKTTDSDRSARIEQIRLRHNVTGAFCLYEMEDSPGIQVPNGYAGTATDCFTGIVLDVCKGCTPATQPYSFQLVSDGAVTRDGAIVSGTGVAPNGTVGSKPAPVKPPMEPCQSKPSNKDCGP
jgi:hypothetical protein